MRATYEPGTVAIATVRGEPNVRVFFDGGASLPWTSAIPVDGDVVHYEGDLTDIRPLVVLDLGPGSTPATEAVRLLRTGDSNAGYETFLDWLASQIEAQTKRTARFPLGSHVRFIGEVTSSDAWAKRRDKEHLGIVVENDNGDARVYDTVERDWWVCDEGLLAAVEAGS